MIATWNDELELAMVLILFLIFKTMFNLSLKNTKY